MWAVLWSGLAAGGAALGFASYVATPRLTPELRGYDLAERFGCHGCHGPRGTGGVPNPKSREQEIPAWDGGTAMMYVNDESEIREWILDGHPRRLAREHHSHADIGGERRRDLPIRMPAFRGVIDDGELADLVEYYKAMAVWDAPPDAAHRGYTVAAQKGCFGCHGPGGMIGGRNPNSFKGYIPPWHGKDFAELVKNEEELRRWIRKGSIPRLEGNPLARFFTRRQVIQMPVYDDVLTQAEEDDIVAYIHWLSRDGR